MKIISAFILALAFASNYSLAETKMSPQQQEMMKKMHEAATPGEPHKVLAQMEGKWSYNSKMWDSADAKPQESKGESTFKMLLGGRYLHQEVKGKAMGMDFQGVGITAYDNVKKKYDSIWMDSMGTGIMKGTGDYDPASKTLTDKGEYSCPMKESKTAEYRSEWKLIDKNNSVFSMYGKGMMDDAKEFKMMELTYKRK